MSALFKLAVYVVFLLSALAISLHFLEWLSPENVASAPAKPEAAAAPVDPAGTAAIDEELDYWAAQKIGSLDGWRSFLAAHGSGVYAQAARTEMQKLLPAEKASAPARPEAAAAPVDPVGTAAIDEELDYWAAQKVGSLDGWRSFLAAHGSGVYAQAARTEMQKLLPAEKASAPAKPEAAAAPVDPAGTAAIEEELDYWAAQKVGSLDGWRSFLAAHGSGVYAQAARTEMQKLLPAEKASAPAKPEATSAASPDGNALAAYPRGTEAASFTPDDICKRDGDRLARLRDSRSSEEAARFANELGCEKLRPQLLGLMESWGRVASAPASAELPNGSSLDAKAAGVAPGTAFAVEYEHGATAYNRGEFATAKRLWLPLAEQGDARAQLGLALMYFLGQGVQVNMAAALDWCQKAADHGLVAAQYELGQIYEHPWRPELQDFAEAAKWYEKAADQGYANAQEELGGMYEFGLGVPTDYAEAEKWFAKAQDYFSIAKMYDNVARNRPLAAKWYRRLADQGNKDAEFRLGEMYRNGTGVPLDYASAHMWFNLAAGSGHLRGSMARDELALKMSPAQIAKAQRLAREWKPTK